MYKNDSIIRLHSSPEQMKALNLPEILERSGWVSPGVTLVHPVMVDISISCNGTTRFPVGSVS